MRNRDKWHPSKYVYRKGRLVATRDRNEIAVGSRLIADLVAGYYEDNLKQHAKGKLLDLGCGKVPLYDAYKQHVADNVCVDWENTLNKSEHLDFECDLTKVLPFEESEFDTIILSDVLEHIPEPEHLWKEMSRILSLSGKIMMNVPFYYWLHERPHDYYRYTEYGLRRFVEDSGLRLVQLEPIGGTPEILADILAKHFQFVPLIGNGMAIAIQYIVGLFIRTGLGKAVSEMTSHAFPLGYFLIAEKA